MRTTMKRKRTHTHHHFKVIRFNPWNIRKKGAVFKKICQLFRVFGAVS